jgi:orotidine-5'-phosphate decarboxylase
MAATGRAGGPRVVVALDFSSGDEAMQFARRLAPGRCRLKVGLELFVAAGPEFVGRLTERGFDVFLDLKFHDIPNTVAQACTRAAALGVWMVNVHALGGAAMLRAAREAIDAASHRPLLVAVTVLTSHAPANLPDIGIDGDAVQQVRRLADLAQGAGLDGVVCSAQEAAELRAKFGQEFVLVTPGIRPAGSAVGDQSRVMTPAQALRAGSNFLVVGRPVTRAPDPLAALDAIEREIGGVD